jgi:hypothetical protein
MTRKSNRKPIVRTPAAWQQDASQIETATVQYWRNGVMITAQMTKESAQSLVRDGAAFVICRQAIGAVIDGSMAS